MQIDWHVLTFTTVSTFTKGEQMVPVLNKLDVRCAVYGNHDFGKYDKLFLLTCLVQTVSLM